MLDKYVNRKTLLHVENYSLDHWNWTFGWFSVVASSAPPKICSANWGCETVMNTNKAVVQNVYIVHRRNSYYALYQFLNIFVRNMILSTHLCLVKVKVSVFFLFLLLLLWCNSPTRARAASFLRFLDHTQWHTTVSRTSLDERSVRHGDLYLTTRNTHKRQTSMPPAGFEPPIPANHRPQTTRPPGSAQFTVYPP